MASRELTALVARVNKKYGAGTIVSGSELAGLELPRCTTGSLAFDLMLGGGWPLNQWNEIIGQEHHGKTVMALKTIAANQAIDPDYEVLWVASEQFVPTWAEKCGVDLDRIQLVETTDMETAYQIMLEAAEGRAADAIILDSYPALIPRIEEAKDMGESNPGRGALLTGQFFRKVGKGTKRSLIDGSDRPMLGIIINQWREKIGVTHGDPRTTPGGKAKNFAFFTRVEVSRAEWIDHGSGEGKRRVGIAMKARTHKNKTAPSQRQALVDFYFDDASPFHAGEYDTVKETVNIAMAFEIIDRKGAWYYFHVPGEAEQRKWNGKDGLWQEAREEPALAKAIADEVRRVVLHKLDGDEEAA